MTTDTFSNFSIGDKVLVTTNEWFYAPNGKNYRAVFGTLRGIHSDQETLGVKTNAKSTNWYAEVGRVLMAGCQIHYVVRCDSCDTGDVDDFEIKDGQVSNFVRPSYIYSADADA